MMREGVKKKGGGGGGATYYQYFFSFITKFSFDLNRRVREMGEVGVVRGGWRALLPPPCPWTYRGEMIRL